MILLKRLLPFFLLLALALPHAALAAPLHMAPAFLFFSALTFADKRGITKALLNIARSAGAPPGIEGI